MFDFSQIDEVKLAQGGHGSPQEGLCFMEMAAWFAGEKHSDKPACSCPVLGAYGIRLNDRMPDDVRDRLLKPLVPMIVGTRDNASEQKRTEFLALWATNKVLPIVLRQRGFADHATACENAKTLSEARNAANAAANSAAANYAANAAAAANSAAANSAAANYAANAAAAASAAANSAAEIWTIAVEGLRQAILVGRHEGFADPEPVIVERRQKLRELVG